MRREFETENDLLLASRSGDRQAVARLLAPHQRGLLTLCRGTLADLDEADDAVQETFYRAIRGLPRFQGGCALRTWLFRIALNVCLEWKRSRRKAEPLDMAAGLPNVPAPEAEVVARTLILEALAGLPKQRRALLVVREAEGWTIPEIAEAFGWSGKKVENELYKARRALAEWRKRHDQGD